MAWLGDKLLVFDRNECNENPVQRLSVCQSLCDAGTKFHMKLVNFAYV